LEVHIGSEFDHGPEVAVVEITPTLDTRIRQLASAAKALGVYKVAEFDCSPDFFLRDYESEEDDGPIAYRLPDDEDEGNICRVECVTLNVTSDDYYWSGFVKHTNVRWETDTVPLGPAEPNEPANQPAPYLGIVLQGGIIQSIVSDQPEVMADWKVMVIDYDTESTPDEDLVSVPQSDGSESKAWSYLDSVTQTAINLQAVYAALS
jgi:hypothetical protein